MARVKKGVNAHKRHKKVLKQAKGFYGLKSKVYRAAKPAVMRSLRSAYVGRKLKKREYRRLWIARINAAATERCFRRWLFTMHRHSQLSAIKPKQRLNKCGKAKKRCSNK